MNNHTLAMAILTDNQQKTGDYSSQGTCAEFQRLPFLEELAAFAPVRVRTDALVLEPGLLVDAGSSVQTRVVQTLVPIDAGFALR